jgi:hypothetical protein
MKKALVMGLMALGAVASSYGQGHIWFDNYSSTPYMPVVYGSGYAKAGQGVDSSNIHVDLLFTLGVASSASTDLGLSVPINPTSVDATPAANHGYFQGGIVNIPGYVSGPVTFQVEAWDTTTGSSYGTAGTRGISFAWQESSLATGSTPANFFAGLPGPSGDVTHPLLMIPPLPEPSVFALSSISAAALMLIRRWK